MFELFNKSYTTDIIWQEYETEFYARFTLENLIFNIRIQFRDYEDLKQIYNFEKRYSLSDNIFEDKIIVKIEYSQINTNQEIQLKVLSTVAIEVSKKLKNEKN
jgi:hypothetical protein